MVASQHWSNAFRLIYGWPQDWWDQHVVAGMATRVQTSGERAWS